MSGEGSPGRLEVFSNDSEDLVKPFVCDFPECIKSFTRAENLNRHKLNHQPNKIYKCPERSCSRSFVRNDLLKRHQSSHGKQNRRKRACLGDEGSLGKSSSGDSPPDWTDTTQQDSLDNILKNFDESPLQGPSTSTDVPVTVADLNQVRLSSSTMIPFCVPASTHPIPVLNPESYLNPFEGAMSDNFTSWLLSATATFESQPLPSKSSLSSASNDSSPFSLQCDTSLSTLRRLELLDYLSTEARNLPSLQLHKCNEYIARYFSIFHPQLPIIHVPTFDPNSAPAPLILAIMAYGSYHSDFNLSQTLIHNLRWVVFSSPDFEPPVQIWIIQALLLIEAFEKTMASRHLHALAHIFHATTLTLLKRRNFFNEVKRNTNSDENIFIESIKRVVFAAFLLDASHAAIFGHSLVLSVDELRLSLPCDDVVCNNREMTEPPPDFLVALKGALKRIPVETNSFGRFIIMHGLLSVTWHMRQRDRQNSNGVGLSGFKSDWPIEISRALDAWKDHYDKHIEATSSSNILDDYRVCMYHHSCILLSASLIDVQVYAGAKYITGRAVSHSDIVRIDTYMQQWAVTVNARWAVVHAARLLHEVVKDGWEARKDPVMMRPWGVYHATLVIWSYGYAMSHQPGTAILPLPSELSIAFDHWQPEDEDNFDHMDFQQYIDSVRNLADGDELLSIPGLSRTLGVLMRVRRCLANCGWELRESV